MQCLFENQALIHHGQNFAEFIMFLDTIKSRESVRPRVKHDYASSHEKAQKEFMGVHRQRHKYLAVDGMYVCGIQIRLTVTNLRAILVKRAYLLAVQQLHLYHLICMKGPPIHTVNSSNASQYYLGNFGNIFHFLTMISSLVKNL